MDEPLEAVVHEQRRGLGQQADVLASRLAVGDHERDLAGHGLLVEARPVEGLGVLQDDDRGASDGGALCVRDGEAVGHARLAHGLAGHEGLAQGVGVVGDAELGGLQGDDADGLLARGGVLVQKDALGADDVAHSGSFRSVRIRR